MDLIIEYIRKMDIGEIIVIGVMFWFFYNRLNLKIEKLSEEIGKVDEKLSERIDKIDSRLSRLEFDMVEVKTVLRMKECCMIKDESQMKKAE